MKKATLGGVTYRTEKLSINKVIQKPISLNARNLKVQKMKVFIWNERIEISKAHPLAWFLSSTIKAMENTRDLIKAGGL